MLINNNVHILYSSNLTLRECLGFKFLFHMFGLRFLEKELETLRFQVPFKWEKLEPPLLWGGSSFHPQGFKIYFLKKENNL